MRQFSNLSIMSLQLLISVLWIITSILVAPLQSVPINANAKSKCDIHINVNNRESGFMLYTIREKKVINEAVPDNCKIEMKVDLEQFITKWSQMDQASIDVSSLPPLFYFIVKSNGSRAVPLFGDYSLRSRTAPSKFFTKVFESGYVTLRGEKSGEHRNDTCEVYISVNRVHRASVYLEKPEKYADMPCRMSILIDLNSSSDTERPRLNPFFTFFTGPGTVTNYGNANSKYEFQFVPSFGVPVALVKPINLTELALSG